MLSYDYCHFEFSKGTDQEVTNQQIDDMRKDCMRLADKAISQYQIAKVMAAKRRDGELSIQNFVMQCENIKRKNTEDRTVKEMAMLKQYEDENWQDQFDYDYDYEDEVNQ